MQISIITRGDTCALCLRELHNSSELPLPLSRLDVIGALESMLLDPILDHLDVAPVQFVRREDAIVVITKDGSFTIHWRYLHNLVAFPGSTA
jgi:hypothetical protein